MSERGRRKRWGFGCLIVLAVVVLIVTIVAGLTWSSSRSADPRSAVLVHDRPDSANEPLHDQQARTAGIPLRVQLELDGCEVYIEPGAPGEPLTVEAHYDAHDYLLEEIVEEGIPELYRLRFLATTSMLITGLKQGLRGGQPQLRIRLPVDRPLELMLQQRNGGAFVDLGGLHLLAADFDTSGTLLNVDADERLQGELERFTVKASKGVLMLESLDRMRPRRVDIDFRMGQAQIDFRGSWISDTSVDLSLSIADIILRLPRDARINGLDSDRFDAPFSEELPAPTLSFTLESGRRTTLRVFD